MLFKEVEDCDNCPLRDEICQAGRATLSGLPADPACAGFDDDTDLEEYISGYYEHIARLEKIEQEKLRKKREKERKAEIQKKRREYLNCYCVCERNEVKRIKNQIRKIQNLIDFAESAAFAFNITNEAFGYPERREVRKDLPETLKNLEKQLVVAQQKLKDKQAACRRTERYKNIK